MGFRQDYNNWTLGRQIQVTFISSSLLLIAILIIITKFQLDWLQTSMINSSRSALDSNLETQMSDLAFYQSRYISSEFSNYISIMKAYKNIELKILGYATSKSYFLTNNMNVNQDLQEVPGFTDYTTAVFMSSFSSLDNVGQSLEFNLSAMQPILPLIYENKFSSIYSGFETDQIIYFFPGAYLSDRTYTPIVREWYYKAQDAVNSTIITEPYQDATTNNWILTVSEALLDQQNVFQGVAGLDILLQDINDEVASIKILQDGFSLLISPDGVLLSLPDSWNSLSSGSTIKIYDNTVTGITSDTWNLVQNMTDGSIFNFADANGTNYVSVFQSIPIGFGTNLTYYLLLCAIYDETEIPMNQIQNNFDTTYNAILWLVVSIGILTFGSIMLLIYIVSRNLSRKLKRIEKILAKMVRKALFPRVSKNIDMGILKKKTNGIESLVDALESKMMSLEKAEDSFTRYNWGTTRPNDKLLYNKWNECLYPYSSTYQLDMPWKQILPKLAQVVPLHHAVKNF